MKKAVLVGMILLVLLCSCKKQVDFEVKKSGFSCDAEVVYNETELKAKLFVGENGYFCAEVTEPEALNGMKCEWSGDKVTVSYLGIKQDIDPENIPYFNYAKLIRDILGDLSSNLITTATNDYFTYNGTGIYGDYRIEFRADGFPIKLHLPSASLTVTFTNFQYVS
ncbi:MAG: hypothetical protein IKV36_01055 [Clostridia bacterium]|nr:hypothetical protein [Clostridia bacterium]